MFYKKRCYNENNDIDITEFLNKIKQGAIILDVRNRREFQEGHIQNAINIPVFEINKEINNIIPNKDQLIVIYCQSGERSRNAYLKMKKIGYSNIYNLKGGLDINRY